MTATDLRSIQYPSIREIIRSQPDFPAVWANRRNDIDALDDLIADAARMIRKEMERRERDTNRTPVDGAIISYSHGYYDHR